MSANRIIQAYARKALTKNQGSGITNIPNQFVADAKAGEILTILQQAGIPINQLDDFIRSEADLLKFLNIIESTSKPRVIPGSSAEGKAITEKLFGKKGEVVEFPQKRTFKEEIDAMKKSGDIVDVEDVKISEKITDRNMFKEANERFNETENFVTNTITKIKGMEPMTAMKEANLVIGRKGRYKNLTPEESKKILQDTEDHIFERDIPIDPEDMAKGGIAGYYTGGMVDVEPNLSDIGHGSDALMARTRLVAPDSQATTSTGLNYLLAEDNDNIRVPFAGGGMSKRAFLKLLATLGGGAAAVKTGILGLGEGVGKKAVTETVKQSVGSGQPPPYFFKLVEKIKTMGDDVTVGSATMPRTKVTRYKNYELTEDVTTGSKEIKKMGIEDDMITKNEYMTYTKGQADETTKGKKPADEYEEVTESNSRIIKDEFNDPDYEDGIELKEILEEVGETVTKKADGGRIGFSAGHLAKLGITGSSRRFLEKVFGKQKFATMIENDPEMHRGMLEVVEMFRKKDKEGLKMYMQKFLPHMDDATVEDFIIGSGGTEGIEGQLIRLGSGRDYAGKLEMMKKADEVKKLQNFDIKNVTKNAEGGRIGFSGGGIFRAIIAKAAAKQGMKPYEFIKKTSYKSLPPEVKMFMSADDFARLKSGQQNMYTNYIDMMKTRKNFQQEVEGGKTTPAKPIFEQMEKMMDEQSYVPKTVTADDIAEAELMVKNRFQKGRKDNAQGGLTTMLGGIMKYDIESILEKYEDDYNPSAMVQGPRNMYNQGQLVQPSSDGSRPGYKGNEITYKGKWEADRYNTVKDINSLKLNKEKVNLKASDFKTGEMRYPDNKGQKYVQQYLDSVQKGYLNNDMSNVTRFKTFIKNKYPKTFAKVIADVNMSGYRGMMDIGVDYKRKLANEIITSSNNQLKYINQFDIIKKLVPANRAAQVKDVGINSLGNLLDEDTLNSFRKLDKMEDKLSKSLTYIVDNDVKILDPSKIKIKGSAAAGYQTQSPIKKMMNYLAGGGSRLQLNKALEQNKWYQSQNYKVGKTTRNTFDDLSQAYSKDFIGQNFNDAYDYALNRRGSVSVTGMSKKITPERLIWNFAARSADRHFKDLDNPKDWLVKIVDKNKKPIDYSSLPVDDKGRRIIDTNKYQFLYEGQTFNKNNLNTKGYQSGLFNDVYKAANTITNYLNTDVPDPDNPKKTISLGELFEKTDGRIFASIGHDDAKGGVKKKPFNTFKILTNVENQALYNAYDKIKSPAVRKQVVDFIYGQTDEGNPIRKLRGDKYKEAWINKNVPFVTEYIKTGKGLEETPYKQGQKLLKQDLLKLAGTKNKKCKGLLSYGGRAGLAEGLSPEFCINEGKKVARDLVAKNIKGSPAQNSIMKRITSGVTNFAKSILDPEELFDIKKQLFSKGALMSIPIFDAVMAADDALRKDMDPKEAFAKTLTFGNIPSAAGFTDNVDILNAKKMLENPNLSPAGKEYAQLIIDSTNLNKGQSDTGIVESFKTLTGGPTNQFKNLQELKDKVSNASTSGRFDYENALAEMQGTFKAKPKENKFFFDDAPDAPDVTPLTNKLATPAKSRGPITEKKKQKVDLTPTTYENYKPYSFTKEEFEDTMRQAGVLKEGQVYNQDFYKEQIETPMKASQFKEYMELPSFRGANQNFSEGGIASLNVKK